MHHSSVSLTTVGACLQAIEYATSDGACLQAIEYATSDGACLQAMKLATSDGACLQAMKLATSDGACLQAMKFGHLPRRGITRITTSATRGSGYEQIIQPQRG